MPSPADRGSRWRHVMALPLAAICLLPLAMMVGGSLRQAGATATHTGLASWPFAFGNYGGDGGVVNLARLTVNSLVVALLGVALSVLVASWAGFAISRLPVAAGASAGGRVAGGADDPADRPAGRPLHDLRLARHDRYLAAAYRARAHWHLASLRARLLRAFRRLPGELFEAARLEGLTPFEAWRRVACRWSCRSRWQSPRWPSGSAGGASWSL